MILRIQIFTINKYLLEIYIKKFKRMPLSCQAVFNWQTDTCQKYINWHMSNIHQRQRLDELTSVNQSSMTAEQSLNWHLSIINDGWTIGELTSVLWVKEEHVTVAEGRLGQVGPGLCCQKSPKKDSNRMPYIRIT